MISGIFGLPGSGKTLFLCAVASRAIANKRLPCGLGNGRNYERVYTNFPVPGCAKFNYSDLGVVNFENCLIIVDEISMFADSRNYKNFSENEIFFFTQHRHFHCDFIYASQNYSDCDKKIRQLTHNLYYISDYAFKCSVVKPIIPFFNVDHGSINQGYQFAPLISHRLFFRPLWYKKCDSYAVIGNKKLVVKSDKDIEVW